MPNVKATGYKPNVITKWAVGDQAWMDRSYTFTDFGVFTPATFHFQIQTSVNSRTAQYKITPATRSEVVVIADSAATAPSLSSADGWDKSCGGYNMVNGGYLHYEVRGRENSMTYCAIKTVNRGETLKITESAGAKTDIFVRHFAETEKDLFDDAVATWAGTYCGQGSSACSRADVQSSAVDSAAHSIQVTSHVFAATPTGAQAAINHMAAGGKNGLESLVRSKGVAAGIDSLATASITITTQPVLGQIQPMMKAVFVVSAVSLFGLDKEHFDTAAQMGFRQVIASHSGQVCGSKVSKVERPCSAQDVKIMTIAGINIRRGDAAGTFMANQKMANRRDTGIMVKFVLTAHNSADADLAAGSLNTYMGSAKFRGDLVSQGGQLSSITSTSIAITPTTAITAGIDGPTAPDDKNGSSSQDGLIAVLSITSALALCGVVLAGMYILKNRSEGGGLSAQDANSMVYGNTVEDAYGVGDNDPDHDQGSYPIPVAEVVGVSSPSWTSVRADDDNQHMDIAMQEMPAMRAAPPSYEGEDDPEKETAKFV